MKKSITMFVLAFCAAISLSSCSMFTYPTYTVSLYIMPTDNVYYVSGQYGGWSEHPLLPKYATTEEILSSHIVGKTMKILFPVIIENITNEYTFEFRVDDAVIQ